MRWFCAHRLKTVTSTTPENGWVRILVELRCRKCGKPM